MSGRTRAHLVLLELAAAAGILGYLAGGPWLIVGAVVAALCLLGMVPINRRPLYATAGSWISLLLRRRSAKGSGVAALVGGAYEVLTIRGSGGVAIGAVRDEATWSVPLALPLVGSFNDESLLEKLQELLQVEDVPLSSVRIVSQAASSGRRLGGAAALANTRRYLVLTLDTAHAADVIAARGGSAGVQQILRRCVLRAEEVMGTLGIAVRRLPASEIDALCANSLGPVNAANAGGVPAREEFGHVDVGASTSATFALRGDRALGSLEQLAAALPVPMLATSLGVQPAAHSHLEPTTSLLLRVSGPTEVAGSARATLEDAAKQLGIGIDRLGGRQLDALRATTLMGVRAPIG